MGKSEVRGNLVGVNPRRTQSGLLWGGGRKKMGSLSPQAVVDALDFPAEAVEALRGSMRQDM